MTPTSPSARVLGSGQAGLLASDHRARQAFPGYCPVARRWAHAPRHSGGTAPEAHRLPYSDGAALSDVVHLHPARLVFATSRAGPLRVQMFDLTGRVVRTLMDRHDAPAGDYTLDVGMGSGPPLRAGLYFYRIAAPEGVACGRFVVVR